MIQETEDQVKTLVRDGGERCNEKQSWDLSTLHINEDTINVGDPRSIYYKIKTGKYILNIIQEVLASSLLYL